MSVAEQPNLRLHPRIMVKGSRAQGVQGLGRPDAAASLHICVAEYFSSTLQARVKRSVAAVSTHTHVCVSEQVNSRLHPKIKSYKGLANQVLPWARMWALQDESIQGSLDHGARRLAHQLLLRHTHTCVCVCVAENMQG